MFFAYEWNWDDVSKTFTITTQNSGEEIVVCLCSGGAVTINGDWPKDDQGNDVFIYGIDLSGLVIIGGSGPDEIDLSCVTYSNFPGLSSDQFYRISVNCGDGDDFVIGSNLGAVINGEGGNDNLTGGGGNDQIYGGDGEDEILGGDGNDELYGGQHNDRIYGENGEDSIHGDDGDDLLLGRNGDDIITGGNGNDAIYGGEGNDNIEGNGDSDTVDGGDGDDIIAGDDGDDKN